VANKGPAAQCSVPGACRLLPPLAAVPDPLCITPVRRGALLSRSIRRLRWVLVMAAEFNRPNITDARPYFPDIDPTPPQLIGGWTGRIVARINGGAASAQGNMPVARRAIIREGPQPWVPGEVGGLEGNGAAGRVPNQVRAQGGDHATAIGTLWGGIARKDGIQQHDPAAVETAAGTSDAGLVPGDGTVQDRQGATGGATPGEAGEVVGDSAVDNLRCGALGGVLEATALPL
jgi:hypothetical protein